MNCLKTEHRTHPTGSSRLLAFALMLLLGASPLAFADKDEEVKYVPYRGHSLGTMSIAPTTPFYDEYKELWFVSAESEADQIATQAGKGTQKSTLTIYGVLFFVDNSPFFVPVMAVGETTAVAADGDEIWIRFVMASDPESAAAGLTFLGTFEIFGGTGRFEGATGEGELSGFAVPTGDLILDPYIWGGEFDGVISKPGPKKSKDDKEPKEPKAPKEPKD